MKNIKGFDSNYYKETVEVSDVFGGTFTEAEQIYLFSSCNCSFTLIVNGSNLGLFQRCDLSFIDYTDTSNNSYWEDFLIYYSGTNDIVYYRQINFDFIDDINIYEDDDRYKSFIVELKVSSRE